MADISESLEPIFSSIYDCDWCLIFMSLLPEQNVHLLVILLYKLHYLLYTYVAYAHVSHFVMYTVVLWWVGSGGTLELY